MSFLPISEASIKLAIVTYLLPEILCVYTTNINMVAVLYTKGSRLQSIGHSAHILFCFVLFCFVFYIGA